MRSRILLGLISFLFLFSNSSDQKWRKTSLKYDARLVHAMASTKLGFYILEGRLYKGGRTNEMLYSGYSKPSFKKAISPNSRDGHSLDTNHKEELLSFGGISEEKVSDELWRYSSNKWEIVESKGSKPNPRWGHGSIYFNEKLWIFGGQSERQSEFLQDLWSWSGENWEQYSSSKKPDARYGCQLGVYNGKIILYGGRNHSGDWFTDTWIWDKEWKKLEIQSVDNKPRASVGFVLISTPSDLYLAGGILKGDSFNEMWKFNGLHWDLIEENIPFNLDFPAGCYNFKENALIITGSNNGIFELWQYQLK